MQDENQADKWDKPRRVPRLYFTLPIPREVVEELEHEREFRFAFRLLRNDAFAALSTLIHAGIEQKCSPDHPLSLPELVEIFARKSRDCREDPERFRADQGDKAVALADYLARGLRVADGLGVAFIPMAGFWGPCDPREWDHDDGDDNGCGGPKGGSSGGGTPVVGNNGSTASAGSQQRPFTQQTRVEPTDEQRTLIDAAACADEGAVLKTEALAGTGKTTACVFLAETRPSSNQIYLAFNRVMVEHARARLGHFMECRTTDSLAYTVVKPWEIWGPERTDRSCRADWTQIASDLGLRSPPGGLKRGAFARQIFQVVLNYCYSSDEAIGPQHLPAADWVKGAEADVLKWANDLWYRMISRDARITVPPAQVMKWWQLGNLSIPYERVIFDEAQDTNPVFLNILQRSGCQTFLVGDSNQQLYGWRGAVDAMAQMSGPEFSLTRSWRSGENICGFANNLLGSKARAPARRIVGHAGLDGIVCPYRPDTYPQWPLTILARTNVQVFAAAVEVAERGHRLHLVGDIKELQWMLMDALRLFRGSQQAPTHWMLAPFPSWHALGVEVDLTGDPELKRVMQIVEARHDVLEHQLEKLARFHQRDETRAPAILATTHRVKGREWDRVMLMDDFIAPEELGMVSAEERDAELNVLYVAATRARRELYVPGRFEPYLRGELAHRTHQPRGVL